MQTDYKFPTPLPPTRFVARAYRKWRMGESRNEEKAGRLENQPTGSDKEATPYISLTQWQAVRLPPDHTIDQLLYVAVPTPRLSFSGEPLSIRTHVMCISTYYGNPPRDHALFLQPLSLVIWLRTRNGLNMIRVYCKTSLQNTFGPGAKMWHLFLFDLSVAFAFAVEYGAIMCYRATATSTSPRSHRRLA
ncbi:hypothetical protein N7474_004370 [Penicillium riverlandense]|uniref:uncharacterized protein n=1 Tax=Penicillium riverlandense TaxID=1903569 RepID=UPI002547F4DF|nr:uncharacterized protein N7474_004370 [Penicillium riverlandense]KAJ5818779.1 hypothetical protein N7474_004370 [Penicillium riverlandense]